MRVLVIVPVHDGPLHIEQVLRRTRADLPDADMLVVDDTGGEADRVEKIAHELGRIELLRRPAAGQRLPPATLAGFRIALAKGYELVVELDARAQRRTYTAEDLGRVDLDTLDGRGRWWRLVLARRLRRVLRQA